MRIDCRVYNDAVGANSPMVTDMAAYQARRKGVRAYQTPMIYTHCKAVTPIDRVNAIGADKDAMFNSLWY